MPTCTNYRCIDPWFYVIFKFIGLNGDGNAENLFVWYFRLTPTPN